MREEILSPLAGGEWVALGDIAQALGVTVRSAAQQLRPHHAAGRVERSDAKPYSFRLVEGGGALAVVERPTPNQPQPVAVEVVDDRPQASFAVWDDGEVSISRGEEAGIVLTVPEVRRLVQHLAKWQA